MKILKTVLVLSLLSGTSHAQLYNHAPSEDNPIQPRVELNHRYSNDRAISMMEFWVPLGQNEEDGSVLFGDLRMMGDNQENKELNVGVGYRGIINTKLLGDGIAGGMVWFDRRKTTSNSEFNQVTAGLEWLGEQYDVRLNGYVPLNKKQSYTRANPNGDGLGFVGNQIIVNTDQAVVEEALPGLDLEIGTRLNFLDGVTDSTRVYAGAYHFEGDRAEDVTGYRARIAADITSDIQVGARYQKDDVRGFQAYLEATVRFPFDAKKSFQEEGLRSRLDESPERDIDIVSNEAVLDDGIDQLVLNANSGVTQNVLHVNNTAGGGGDGSIEMPYNTLLAAQTAATTNDLIYVHRGDGTTTGQDTGVTLDDDGQMLVGSGTNLVYDRNRFRTSNNATIESGLLVEKKTENPIITNGAGNGVDVSSADNILLSGFTVDGASAHGVYALNSENLIIDTISSNNNTIDGVNVEVDATNIDQFSIVGSSLNNNTERGLSFLTSNSGTSNQVNISNNIANENTLQGIRFQSRDVGSRIEKINLINNVTNTNTSFGAFGVASIDSVIEEVNVVNNVMNSNGRGLQLNAQSAGTINIANVIGNTAKNNTTQGLLVQSNNAGSFVGKANFINNLVEDSSNDGIQVWARDSGILNESNIINNEVSGSAIRGIYALAQTSGNLNKVDITGNTSTGNDTTGITARVLDDSDISQLVISRNNITGNTTFGVALSDENAASTISADLGGGVFGGVGGNIIRNNGFEEIRVDLDGLELKAENNYWGSSNGLTAGETALIDGSTIDATPFLTKAP